MPDLRLAVVLEAAVDRLTGPLRGVMGDLGRLGRRAAAAEATVGRTAGVDAQAAGLSRLGMEASAVVARLGEAGRANTALGRIAQQVDARLQAVKGVHAQVDAHRALAGQLGASAQRLEEARAEVTRLAREMRAADSPTQDQVRQFERAKRTAGELKRSHASLAQQLERSRRGLHAAGVSTQNLSRDERRLREDARGLNAQLTAQAKRLERLSELGNQSRRWAKVGLGMTAAGVGLGMLASRARGAGRALLNPLADLEQVAARLRSLPGLGEDQVQAAIASGRAWSRAHADTASDYVTAVYEMVSAGLDFEAAVAATETAMTVAKATGGDSAETAKLLGTLYNNLGDKTKPAREELARLGDMLVRVQQTFQLSDMDQLAQGMNYGASAAVRMGVDVTQAAAAIGALNSAGMDSSRAGTGFNAMLAKMLSASKELEFSVVRTADGGVNLLGTLRSMETTLGDVRNLTDAQREALRKAFDEQGGAAVLGLLNNLELLEEGHRKAAAAAGAAAEAQTTIEAGPLERMKIAQNNMVDFQMTLSEQLLPALTEAIPMVTELVGGLADFAKEHPALTKGLLLAAAAGTVLASTLAPVLTLAGSAMTLMAGWKKMRSVVGETSWMGRAGAAGGRLDGRIGGLGRAFGALVMSVSRAGLAFLATPAGWLTAAVMGLGAALAYVITQWDELTGQTNTFTQASPELVKQLREDTAFREARMQDALAGHEGMREALKQALPAEPLDDVFRRADEQRKADKRQALLERYGLADATPTTPGVPAGLVEQLTAAAGGGRPMTIPELARQQQAAPSRAPAAAVREVRQDYRYEVTVHAAPGEDPETIAKRVMKLIEARDRARAGASLADPVAV